jgi:hypothetical protein
MTLIVCLTYNIYTASHEKDCNSFETRRWMLFV